MASVRVAGFDRPANPAWFGRWACAPAGGCLSKDVCMHPTDSLCWLCWCSSSSSSSALAHLSCGTCKVALKPFCLRRNRTILGR
eukprot:3939353-Rhodomonas_salina.2